MLGSAFWVIFLGLFVQCLGSLCTFYFIYKIVSVSILFKSMQSNIRGGESLNERLASVLLLDKESDALHKINYYIYKDTEHKYFGC